MNKNINILSDIAKLSNKLKRNEDRIDESIKVSESIREQIRKNEMQYMNEIAPQLYVSLDVIQKQFGDDGVTKVKKDVHHVAKLKDFKWQESRFECWVCQLENHMNMCIDNTQCDRKLDTCIGSQCTMIQVKDSQGWLF